MCAPVVGNAVFIKSGKNIGSIGIILGDKRVKTVETVMVMFQTNHNIIDTGRTLRSSGAKVEIPVNKLIASNGQHSFNYSAELGAAFGSMCNANNNNKRTMETPVWYFDDESEDGYHQTTEINSLAEYNEFIAKCNQLTKQLDSDLSHIRDNRAMYNHVARGEFTLWDKKRSFNFYRPDDLGKKIINFYAKCFKTMIFKINPNSKKNCKVFSQNGFCSFKDETEFNKFLAAYNLRSAELAPNSYGHRIIEVQPNIDTFSWQEISSH
ncbi:hypothetical protein I3271_05200 [Photobacterium leiognathi]|uniref:hypothetical protein n=1 Tax=Photobacterium leiognathi TaxID=553611 RepID=UPI001EE115FC|nr:hypothetical protein [Photobacterium leiognathi]MCG3884077.1 hypothetical protein [Photobacterium leiognathi]